MQYKNLWDLDSAMQVLTHDTVDSKLWAEAVEWLIVYGPPEIRKLLLNASRDAISGSFPDLQPSHFNAEGQPVYDVGALAKSLAISEEEVQKILAEKELQHRLSKAIGEEPPIVH